MRVDNGVNYSSFMQHFNPLEIKTVDASEIARQDQPKRAEKQEATEEVASVNAVSAKQQPEVVSASESVLSKVRGAAQPSALEDIKVDLSTGAKVEDLPFTGFGDGSIREAISAMEKDSVLHEYQYFVGNHRPETLVDNADGSVVRLATA
ncbi:MAG: hypothetical protein IJP92_11570 [Lachnospiraceae bacterium]|nr:hypothetical protein [Lachnospiraceae bacterium]